MFKTLQLNKLSKILKPLFFAAVLFLFTISVYHFYFGQKIIPGVSVGGVNVGGLPYNQAKFKLEQKESTLPESLTFVYEDKTFEIKPSETELEYNHELSVIRAFELGRSGNLLVDTKNKIAGIIKTVHLPASYSFSDEAFGMVLSGIKGEINMEARDAAFVLQDNKLVRTPSNDGLKVDSKSLYDQAIHAFNTMNYSKQTILVEYTKPSIQLADLTEVQPIVEKAVFTPPVIKQGKKEWKISSQQALDLVQISRNASGVYPELNDSAFEAYAETLGSQINQTPRGRITEVRDGKVINFEITRSGKEIDVKEFGDRLSELLYEGGKTVEIPVKEVETSNDKDKYGLYALLGEGVSKFTGSAAARIHNLSLAAERTNGVLIPPNSIYSFNSEVGDISASTGYNSAYIIQNGRTVLGEGGGVCQTSTTLFRAVLNSGLPITTRYPHAYRVGYYEIDSPVGFDASIFQPSLDFQFKNDTPSYILVQSEVDKANYTLHFRIYGTPDGRSVEISKPIVTDVIPAPEALYQDDPTLEKGKTKQVDWAANGATVSFTREVSRSGKVLYKDVFNSKYQPWRAVYLVGTKD